MDQLLDLPKFGPHHIRTCAHAEVGMAELAAWISRRSTCGPWLVPRAVRGGVALVLIAGWIGSWQRSDAVADDRRPEVSELSTERPDAVQELEQARRAVAEARRARETAQRALDRMGAVRVAERPSERSSRDTTPTEAPEAEPLPPIEDPASGRADRLSGQLEKLHAERDELLTHLTTAHPRAVELQWKIANLEKRLAAGRTYQRAVARLQAAEQSLRAAIETELAASRRFIAEKPDNGKNRESGPPAADLPGVESPSEDPEPSSRAIEGNADARDVSSSESKEPRQVSEPAIDHPDAPAPALPPPAAREHAVQKGPGSRNRPEPARVEPTPQVRRQAAARTTPAYKVEQPLPGKRLPRATAPRPVQRPVVSQPVALWLLVAALVMAALAAARLACSDGNTPFSNIGDVAATLRLPVVGVIPSAGAAGSVARNGKSTTVVVHLVWQVIVALIVFGIVAYAVQTVEIFKLEAGALEGLTQAIRNLTR